MNTELKCTSVGKGLWVAFCNDVEKKVIGTRDFPNGGEIHSYLHIIIKPSEAELNQELKDQGYVLPENK